MFFRAEPIVPIQLRAEILEIGYDAASLKAYTNLLLTLSFSERQTHEEILSQENRNLPTLEDVARLAGVSTATVSRCLNNPERLRDGTRARVESAIAELGYTPHFGGRALASKRTNTIGVVIPTMRNAIFAHGLQSFEDELSKSGVSILAATTHYDPLIEAQQIKTLIGRGVDGLALVGEARPEATYRLLEERGMPFILLWMYRHDCPHPCVGFDNRATARRMAELVLDRGHRRIAMIAGITTWNDRATARVAGVREALRARDILLEPPWLVEARYLVEECTEAAIDLLSLSPRPTAIICGNDVQAAGALRAARMLSLSVPDDVSVVGFDDIELAIAISPPLTTVRVPHNRMGQVGAKLLLDLVRTRTRGASTVFEPAIIERNSLAAPPAAR